MDTLWAPWRMEFIKGDQKHDGCIFCDFPAEQGEGADRRNLIVARSQHAFVILNRYPYNNGHVMVIPRKHTADFTALSREELTDLHALLQTALAVVKEVYRPDGFNMGMNLGRVAGAGIADHLHWHIVPRWGGDTNFMPVVGNTKVMIEHLAQSHETLSRAFSARASLGI
ncbi:MAG: HIT family protein [Myxococcaceae bacterium]